MSEAIIYLGFGDGYYYYYLFFDFYRIVECIQPDKTISHLSQVAMSYSQDVFAS